MLTLGAVWQYLLPGAEFHWPLSIKYNIKHFCSTKIFGRPKLGSAPKQKGLAVPNRQAAPVVNSWIGTPGTY